MGETTRWSDDMDRGSTFSILPVYTTENYLPFARIQEGFFNAEEFPARITDELLLLCQRFPAPRSIMCLDNLGTHTDPHVQIAIKGAGLKMLFLSPLFPDFSPIELTLSLEACIKRHFHQLRYAFQNNCEDFLRYTIENSSYDRFATERFRYCAGGYLL